MPGAGAAELRGRRAGRDRGAAREPRELSESGNPQGSRASHFFETFEALDPEHLDDGESWRTLDDSTYCRLYDYDDGAAKDGVDAKDIGDEVGRQDET